jgi:hypothetical protein
MAHLQPLVPNVTWGEPYHCARLSNFRKEHLEGASRDERTSPP